MSKSIRVPNRGLGKLYPCLRCGRLFANRNQAHSCGQWTVEQHFVGKPKHLRKLFDRFIAMVQRNGPIRLHPVKTRIGIIARMNFASATPTQDKLRCHLVVARKIRSPRIDKTESFKSMQHAVYFSVQSEAELDDELQAWIDQAYRMGMQEFLSSKRNQ